MILAKIFTFDSAHRLPNYEGKCSQLHGHSWKLIVSLEGKVNPKTGMIIDFHQLNEIIEEKILNKLDHAYLNDIIENPTCENLLMWISNQLKTQKVIKLKKLTLYENETSFCELEY